MEPKLQYFAKIESGTVIEETGAFFKAAPFEIEAQGKSYACIFKHLASGRVVYDISSEGKTVEELTHPDYVPEKSLGDYTDPETLSADQKIIFAALLKLDISKDKTYLAYFEKEDIKASMTYTVKQAGF
jgi:hypothetical protein